VRFYATMGLLSEYHSGTCGLRLSGYHVKFRYPYFQSIKKKTGSDTVAPESARKKSGAVSEKEMTVTQHFTAMVSAFKKLSHARAKFEQAMEDFNDNFDGSPEQAKIVLEQTSALVGTFEELHDFMEGKVMLITQLRDAAQALIDGEGRKKAVKSSAENTRSYSRRLDWVPYLPR